MNATSSVLDFRPLAANRLEEVRMLPAAFRTSVLWLPIDGRGENATSSVWTSVLWLPIDGRGENATSSVWTSVLWLPIDWRR